MYIEDRKPGESGRDFAYRIIKDNIIYREFKPGTMLSEKEIGERLGLSRTPIREALRELSKTQIVEILPQVGNRVSYIRYDMVEEADFVRMTLEKAIVEMACEVRTEDDLTNLNENLILQSFYLEKMDHIKLTMMDDAFHKKLFQICNKLQTYTMMQELCIHFDRIRDLSIGAVKDLKIVDDHRKIAEAIGKRDKKSALDMIQHHLERFKLDEKDIRSTYPEFFQS